MNVSFSKMFLLKIILVTTCVVMVTTTNSQIGKNFHNTKRTPSTENFKYWQGKMINNWCPVAKPKDCGEIDPAHCKSGVYTIFPPGRKPFDVYCKLTNQGKAWTITHLVVDEAHCILSWGNSDFRPAYQKLGLLRAVMKDSNILALTATANGMSQKNICSSLRMKEPVIIVESPDRPNVYLSVEKRPPSTGGENTAEESMFKTVDPIIQELKTKMENYRKTIVYVPLKWCGVLHQRTVTSIGNVTSDTEAESFSPIVSQYHSPQSQQLKAWITQDMKDLEKGSLRLLYATEAYGMGIDVPDVRHVVHIGPPSTMETFVQEIGRCGRDGEPSSATLFYNNTDLCSTNLNEKMKMYVKNTSICRRQVLLNHFEAEVDKTRNAHNCCDICRRTCQCSLCISTHIEITSASESLLFNKKQKAVALNMLKTYFRSENCIQNSVLPQIYTGLSENLALKISVNKRYADPQVVSEDFPDLKQSYVLNISKIIARVESI